MNKSAALIFSAILSCPSLAFSGTITEDMSIHEQGYDWNAVLSLPKFNGSVSV